MSAIRRHAARLGAVFENAMIVAMATGCSSGGGSAVGADAAADTPVRADALAPADARLGDGGNVPDSPWAPGCGPGPVELYEAGTDGQAACDYGVPLPCGLPPWVSQVEAPLCFLDPADCEAICTHTSACRVANGFGCDDDAGAFVAPDGSPVLVECDFCPNGVGRRPAGLVDAPVRAGASPVGGFLARCAHLEAASVDAFRTLARELRAFGAPTVLVGWARRSARDEVRHARTMARLARARGCPAARPRIVRGHRRSLADLAVENARDERLAAAMKRIAVDETRHAALAWSIAAWAGGRLDRAGRASVDEAGRDAVQGLRRELTRRPDPSLVRDAGVPTPRAALALHQQLVEVLWC